MIKKDQLTTLIFDLGGVIINIDPSLSIKKLSSLSKNSSDILYGLDYKNHNSNHLLNFFFEFEKGLINEKKFRNQLLDLLSVSIGVEKFNKIWNKLILSFNYNLIDIILKLKTRYKIFVLSNTNSIHEKFYNKLCKKEYGFDLKEIFHKVYYSHEINLRKPEYECYQLILDENNLKGNQILFFDDINDNLIASKKLNYNTYKVSRIDTLEKFLTTL